MYLLIIVNVIFVKSKLKELCFKINVCTDGCTYTIHNQNYITPEEPGRLKLNKDPF